MFWYKLFNNRYLSPDADGGAADDKKDDTKVDDKTVDDEVELDFNGAKTKVAKTKIVEHLNAAAGSTQILRKLYEAGVIDEAGNPKVKKDESKPDEKEEKPDDRVAKLEADLEKMRHEQNVDKFAKKLNEVLDLSAQSHDLTKNDPDIASDIREVVLAKFHSNPQADIKQLYKEQVDKKMKFIKKYESKLKDTNDSEGGSGTFTLDKPIDSKGLRDGTARKAAQKLLEGAFKIG